jgi:hypothetical protein
MERVVSAASVGQVHPVRAPGRFLNEQSGADSEPGKVLETAKEALGNKAVKRSLHADLFQMDVLGAD